MLISRIPAELEPIIEELKRDLQISTTAGVVRFLIQDHKKKQKLIKLLKDDIAQMQVQMYDQEQMLDTVKVFFKTFKPYTKK